MLPVSLEKMNVLWVNGRKERCFVWRRKVFRAGSSLAIVIPAKLVEMKGWKRGTELVISVGKDRTVKLEEMLRREKKTAP